MSHILEVHSIKRRSDEFIGTALAVLGAGAVLGTIALVKTAKLALSPITHSITAVKKVWNATDPVRYKEDEKIRKMQLKQVKNFKEMCESILTEEDAKSITFNVEVGSIIDGVYRSEEDMKVAGDTVEEFMNNLEKAISDHGKLSDNAEKKIEKELEEIID